MQDVLMILFVVVTVKEYAHMNGCIPPKNTDDVPFAPQEPPTFGSPDRQRLINDMHRRMQERMQAAAAAAAAAAVSPSAIPKVRAEDQRACPQAHSLELRFNQSHLSCHYIYSLYASSMKTCKQ